MPGRRQDHHLRPIGVNEAFGVDLPAAYLALALGKSELGRMRLDFDSSKSIKALNIESSWHHIGTTRMHADPKQGVVDDNCCVHGLSNLYVAGSSVFPTSGHANPTLTIVALALRLGDHLHRKD